MKLLKFNEYKSAKIEKTEPAEPFEPSEMDGLTTVGPLHDDDDAEANFKDNKKVDTLPKSKK